MKISNMLDFENIVMFKIKINQLLFASSILYEVTTEAYFLRIFLFELYFL